VSAEEARTVGGREIQLSNLDKVFYPDAGVTKGDVIDYYARVAEVMLPHREDRIVSMHRWPDGIEGDDFYQKDVPGHFPDWIRSVEVEKEGGEKQQLVVCGDRATLVYLANQGCIALHPWLCRTGKLDHPDQLVVDLDPPPGGDFGAVRDAARRVRDLFDALRLPTFLKTTGSKGVHLMVPLDRLADFGAVRGFARAAMDLLAARHPDALTTEVRKNKRKGRVFLDVARNAYAQTAVAPYSVRPRPGAPVATPFAWEELGRIEPDRYTVKNLFRRLARIEDPWKGLRRRATGLSRARERLEKRMKDDS